MGWSHFEPVARTDSAPGSALPAELVPRPGPGAQNVVRVVSFLYLPFFFFLLCFKDTRINNTIFDFGWQLLLLSGSDRVVEVAKQHG